MGNYSSYQTTEPFIALGGAVNPLEMYRQNLMRQANDAINFATNAIDDATKEANKVQKGMRGVYLALGRASSNKTIASREVQSITIADSQSVMYDKSQRAFGYVVQAIDDASSAFQVAIKAQLDTGKYPKANEAYNILKGPQNVVMPIGSSTYIIAQRTFNSIKSISTKINEEATEARVAAEKAAKKTAADNAYTADGTFMMNARSFPNNVFTDVNSAFTALETAWSDYTSARTPSTAIDTLLSKYDTFITKKTAYSSAVIAALRNSKENAYVTNSASDATTYGISNQALKDAWAAVDLTQPITTILEKYIAYVEKRSAFDAAIRSARKAVAKTAWTTLENTADTARSTWERESAQYIRDKNAIPGLKQAYDNAQTAADSAVTKQTTYNNATTAQTNAYTALNTAYTALANANNTARINIESTYTANSTFMTNAAVFPNDTLRLTEKYNDMTAKWTIYTTKRTALSGTESTNISAITDAIDALITAYDNFTPSKAAYLQAAKSAISTSTEGSYVTSNSADATSYGIMDKYQAMVTAWAAVTASLQTANDSMITAYNAYLSAKSTYAAALLDAQGRKAQADFTNRLEASKSAMATWIASAPQGCRNIKSTASTNPQTQEQAVTCAPTEFLSGYTKVTGYDAAPTDTNVTRDNIGQYLAYKYSCCTAPIGSAGNKGATGLPGTNGVDGAKGSMGPKGVPGAIGPVGVAGPKGGQGKNGEQGEQGPDGARGPTGLKGENGKNVIAKEIKQVAGPTGPKGPDGSRGPIGGEGPEGKALQPPAVEQPTRMDKILSLLSLQNKIRDFIVTKEVRLDGQCESPSMQQGEMYQHADYSY